MISFKIRRKSDGLFSTGGTTPKFTKNGKTWSSIGALKNHLNLMNGKRWDSYWKQYLPINKTYYDDCEVVELNITETYLGVSDFVDLH